MYCSNLSFKFYPQTQKKLVGFSHYGHFSTSFSRDFPQLCKEPHCWPREPDLKSSDWIGLKTLHLKNLNLSKQLEESKDIQIYGWKVLEGLLCLDGPYKLEDLEQFDKWMKETKVYDNYIISKIKEDLIKRYAIGTKREFVNDFPELCNGTHIWNIVILPPKKLVHHDNKS
jgi:hypothetical protein